MPFLVILPYCKKAPKYDNQMNARKLPSGNWRVQVYLGKDAKGKKKMASVTAPTKTEALQKAVLYGKKVPEDMSVEQAVRRYLAIREPVLSPSTYRGYEGILNAHILPHPFASVRLTALNSSRIQRWVSDIASARSAKTVKNAYGLVTAAVNMFAPELRFNVKLPQRKRPQLYTPSTEDVKTILKLSEGTDLHRVILLGAVGMMRRGEIAALDASDLDFTKNTIRITKSMVRTSKGEYVIKPPKTEASNRTVVMPSFVMNELPREGRVIDLNLKQISDRFAKLLDKADVPHFRFHDLRHYAASIAASSSIGASVEAIKARGGWSGDSMMKRVYINQIGDEVDKDTAAINQYYADKLS